VIDFVNLKIKPAQSFGGAHKGIVRIRVNLKIKPSQSFRGAHKNMMCVRMFIGMNTHTCMRIYIYTVFLKKKYSESPKHVIYHC
jgi:hypothetical protein